MKKYVQILKNEDKTKKRNKNSGWILLITLLSFAISLGFSFISETLLPDINIALGIILILAFILIGALFDMIGVAVASANEAPFHSMASQKVKGASLAIKMIKNANKVSSFCNDVIGDICGIISGSAGITVALKISTHLNTDLLLTTLIITALIASMTIGGKACGKNIALNKSNMILYETSKLLSIFKK